MTKTNARAGVSVWAWVWFALLATSAAAEVKPAAVFGDHMVLQRRQEVPVWGTAKPGEKVTVTIGSQTAAVVTDTQGRWRVDLPAMEAGGPHELTVQGGSNTVAYADVLVGEVWLCSGQSNMVWPVIWSDDADLEIASADRPRMRLFQVPDVMADAPSQAIAASWQVCGPQTAGNFSAVAYYFGRQLHETLGVPVGLISSAWGGSPIEAWTPVEAMRSDPALRPLLDRWDQGKQDPNLPPFFRPGVLYNGKIAPLIPYGIRGVIWYQGESNAARAYQYRTLFPLMIGTWRRDWGRGDFPFYFVQLANFNPLAETPTESDWSELREAQLMTMQKVPSTGMAVSIDIGEATNIHPTNKRDVGRRLARWALAKDYGVTVAFCGPIYKSMQKQGDKIALTFEHAGDGLTTRDGQPLKGFAIAGADRHWHWAQAQIAAPDTVTVWSDKVPDPAAARYGWALNPPVSLYNKAGLPASPFRTDDWPGITTDLN